MTDPRIHAPESDSDSGAKSPAPEQAAAAAAAYARAAADEGNGTSVAQAAAAARAAAPAPPAPAPPAPAPPAPAPPAPAPAAADSEQAAQDAGDAPDGDPQADEIAELSEKAAKADEYLALAQRTKADFENYRKRAVRDAAAAQERGALKLVQSLLPAIDNLDRALAHYDPGLDAQTPDGAPGQEGREGRDNDTASLVAGIKQVHADVLAALGRVGIESFDPVGEPFDPQYHEAVAQQPADGTPAGIVVEVFQRGYRLGETVVRPARVVVAG